MRMIVNEIVWGFHSGKITLFCSWARGEATDKSDMDLLLEYDGSLSKRKGKVVVPRLFPFLTFSMGLLVFDSEEFYRRRKSSLFWDTGCQQRNRLPTVRRVVPFFKS